jgi:hypothetical protein
VSFHTTDDDNPCAGENVLRKELRGAGSNNVSPEGMEREERAAKAEGTQRQQRSETTLETTESNPTKP